MPYNFPKIDIDSVISDYLENSVGSYEHSEKYYQEVLQQLAIDFFEFKISSDDISSVSEWLFAKVSDDFKHFQEFPPLFSLLMELNWEMRNDSPKAVKSLERLKDFLPTKAD